MQHNPLYHEPQEKLLAWYAANKREMPWRVTGNEPANVYHVWLSEIMLQQTTVTAVIPYFKSFIDRWPSIHDLAAANQDDILALWAGLGYYARARNLHKCAKVIVQDYEGVFPEDYKSLLTLPGIGPYTAAAIASIAFEKPVVAVDGNVERVTSRYFAFQKPLPQGRKELKKLAESLGEFNPRPSQFTQAFMELGSQICTPKSPKCPDCPWQESCLAYKKDLQNILPLKQPKKKRPVKYANVYWIENEVSEVLLHRRKPSGLLGGMLEFPNSDWVEYPQMGASPVQAQISEIRNEPVIHIFTHLELHLKVHKINFTGKPPAGAYKWIKVSDLDNVGLPTLMKKVKDKVLGI